jgi:hypothetical protein
MFTYEIAPVYNLMEESVLRKMRSLFGWQEPGDGIFNPGIFIYLIVLTKSTS